MKLRHTLFIGIIGMMASTAFATTSEPAHKPTTTELNMEVSAVTVANVDLTINALDGLYQIHPTNMGTFKVEITAVGGHGVDRLKKNGETVDFNSDGPNSPDAITARYVQEMKQSGVNVEVAVIRHWPDQPSEVKDNLLTGERTGNF